VREAAVPRSPNETHETADGPRTVHGAGRRAAVGGLRAEAAVRARARIHLCVCSEKNEMQQREQELEAEVASSKTCCGRRGPGW